MRTLFSLVLLSLENNIVKNMDWNEMIIEFVTQKKRGKNFKQK